MNKNNKTIETISESLIEHAEILKRLATEVWSLDTSCDPFISDTCDEIKKIATNFEYLSKTIQVDNVTQKVSKKILKLLNDSYRYIGKMTVIVEKLKKQQKKQ